jgi:signal transduction histidine kinase
MSLRRRFALYFVTFSLFLAVGGGILATRLLTGVLENRLDRELLSMAGAVAGAALPGADMEFWRQGDEPDPFWRLQQDRLRAFLPYVEDAWVVHRGGYNLVSTRPPEELPIGAPFIPIFAFPTALERAWAEGQATTELFRAEVAARAQGEEGALDGMEPRSLYKYAFHRLGDSDAMLVLLVRPDFQDPVLELRSSIVWGALFAAVLAAILAYLLAAGVARPMERLSRAALRIQRGQWDRPVAEEGGDEVGRLSRAMERMRVGILQRDEQLRLMLAQVAHEIRNPLGGLELFAAAAMEVDDPVERQRILGRIRSEVEDLNGIIQDFLSFARPMEPHVRIHDVREPLEEAAELLRMELSGSGEGGFSVDLPPSPLEVAADPDHVKRIVLNLLRNAAHAGSRVRLSALWRNGEAEITVEDDGPGIPDDMRERVFEPFVTDKEQGAGLGLAIVDRLARVNGGRVVLAQALEAPASGEEASGGPGVTRKGRATGAVFHVYLRGADDLAPGEG